jgi:hypothetical protein
MGLFLLPSISFSRYFPDPLLFDFLNIVLLANDDKTLLSFNHLPSSPLSNGTAIIVNGKIEMGKTLRKAHQVKYHHSDRQSIQP